MEHPTPADIRRLIAALPFGPEVTNRNRAVAELLGVHERTIYRWLDDGPSGRRAPQAVVLALEAHAERGIKQRNPLCRVRV